jgi:pimeloyl-ACP methyl ester carboxylesterase
VGEHRGSSTIQEFITDRGEEVCGNAFETFEDCIKDIQTWVDYAKSLGYKEVWLQGHSLGPSKLVYFVTQTNPKDIAGLILLSPSDMIGLVHDPLGIKDHTVLLPEAEKLVAEGKDKQILSQPLWGILMLSAGTYLNFFSTGAKTAIFNYNKLGLGWDTVNKINLPVLAITGTEDDGIVPVMDAYKAMNLLKTELKQSPKAETKVYENAKHGFDDYEQQIVEDVISFITSTPSKLL